MEFRVARAAGAQLPGLTGVVHKGVFGATAAAAKALGAGHEPTMNALGIAGSMASGIKEYYNDPAHTMVKRLNGGWAAQSGTLAALLGQRGYTGPWTVLEGRYGYLNVFSKPGAVEPDLLVDGLGERFAVVDREVKPYAAWGGSHVVIDAIRDLTGAVPIRLDEIDEIHISCSARLVRRRINRRPESVLAAQISLPFLTALAFVHDLADPRIWKDASILHDPELLGVVDRVHCVVDEARDRIVATDGGSGGAAVTVRLRGGGTRQAEVAHSRGSRQRPLGPGELVHKVRSIASDVLPLAQCDQIIAAVEALPHRTDLADLARLLQPVHVPVGAQT
jgi:2-methylcitrate dehydratase PrpD